MEIDPNDTEPRGRIGREHAYPPPPAADNGDPAMLEKLDAILGLVKNMAGRVEALESQKDTARRDAAQTPQPAHMLGVLALALARLDFRDARLELALAKINRHGVAAHVSRLRALTQVPLSEREERELVTIQARVDSAFENIGMRAPAPALYERPQVYRRRVLGRLQRYATAADLRDANLGLVDDSILDRLEPRILKDASRADAITVDLAPGEEKCIERPNLDGTRTREFFRRGSTFIADMKAETRRVTLNDPASLKAVRVLSRAGL